MSANYAFQLEEPCTCCCAADYGGRTRLQYCASADARYGCQRRDACDIAEHWVNEEVSERVKRKVVRRTIRHHLSAFCHACDGHGAIPTDFGREVLALVARHLPKCDHAKEAK